MTQYFTSPRIRILLAKVYLIPSLIYCCELFGYCDSSSMRKLQVLYNNIIRYVHGLKKRDSVSSFSKSLYGVSFKDLINIMILVFLHKIIYTKEPKYLYNLINFARSRRGKRIIIPLRRNLVSEWHFFINAIRLWNAIPHNILLVSNAIHFRKSVYTGLSQKTIPIESGINSVLCFFKKYETKTFFGVETTNQFHFENLKWFHSEKYLCFMFFEEELIPLSIGMVFSDRPVYNILKIPITIP